MTKDEINLILKNSREAAQIIKDESNLLSKKITKEIIKVAGAVVSKIEKNNL